MYKSIRLKKIKVNRKRAEAGMILSEGDTVQCFLADSFFEKETEMNFLNSFLLKSSFNLWLDDVADSFYKTFIFISILFILIKFQRNHIINYQHTNNFLMR